MRILENISEYAQSNNKEFLVIGGHALNAHGYARQTGDLDLLVSRNDKEFWITWLESLKYTATQVHPVFARFAPHTLAEWPIDLMFVEEKIFQQLIAEAVEYDFSSTKAFIPSHRHMIALKLHALKQRQKHREGRDLDDVRQLLRLSPMAKTEFRLLCEKYDRLDVYETLSNCCI